MRAFSCLVSCSRNIWQNSQSQDKYSLLSSQNKYAWRQRNLCSLLRQSIFTHWEKKWFGRRHEYRLYFKVERWDLCAWQHNWLRQLEKMSLCMRERLRIPLWLPFSTWCPRSLTMYSDTANSEGLCFNWSGFARKLHLHLHRGPVENTQFLTQYNPLWPLSSHSTSWGSEYMCDCGVGRDKGQWWLVYPVAAGCSLHWWLQVEPILTVAILLCAVLSQHSVFIDCILYFYYYIWKNLTLIICTNKY